MVVATAPPVLQAAQPDPTLVLPDAGDQVEHRGVRLAGRGRPGRRRRGPAPAALRVGPGCSAPGSREASRAERRAAPVQQLERRAIGRGEVTQIRPSLPRAMLSGWPGRSVDQVVGRARRARRSASARTTVAAGGLGDRDERLVRRRARRRWRSGGRRRASRRVPSGSRRSSRPLRGVLGRCRPSSGRAGSTARGVREVDVAAAVTAALLQTRMGRPSASVASVSSAPVVRVEREQAVLRVADQQPAVGQQLETQRPSAGVPDPPIACRSSWMDPEDRAVLGAGEHPALGVDDDVLGADSRHRDDGQRGSVDVGHCADASGIRAARRSAARAGPPRPARRPGARRAAARPRRARS